jgi:glycosyltransferase involved in cell wall biosynthesis
LRRDGGESFRFQIAGSGPDEDFLRQLVSDKGVEDIVEFLGPVFGEDKMRFWEGIDIFVFPTFHREGLPYTILEALASGTPTLSTRVGGIPDVIQNSVQGVLLDDHDPASVATAIEAMLSDRQRLREMSVAAMQRASDHYGVERLASQFDRIYQELLA